MDLMGPETQTAQLKRASQGNQYQGSREELLEMQEEGQRNTAESTGVQGGEGENHTSQP